MCGWRAEPRPVSIPSLMAAGWHTITGSKLFMALERTLKLSLRKFCTPGNSAFMRRTTLCSVATGCLLSASLAFADAPEACDPQTVAKAGAGYACVVKTKNGPVSWRVEAVSQGSRSFRVVKDLKSGLYVSGDLGKHSQESAVQHKLCNSPDYSNQRGNLTSVAWRLPSGYPRSLNGKNGFPNRDSDFVVLEEDGIREVVSGLANKWFVSSSEAESGGFSYGYDGEFGGIDFGCNGNGNVSLRCVGQ